MANKLNPFVKPCIYCKTKDNFYFAILPSLRAICKGTPQSPHKTFSQSVIHPAASILVDSGVEIISTEEIATEKNSHS